VLLANALQKKHDSEQASSSVPASNEVSFVRGGAFSPTAAASASSPLSSLAAADIIHPAPCPATFPAAVPCEKNMVARKKWSIEIQRKIRQTVDEMPDGFEKSRSTLLLTTLDSAREAKNDKLARLEALKLSLRNLKQYRNEIGADDADVEPGECEKCLTDKLKQATVDGGAGIDLKKYHGGGTWVARDGSKICKRTDEIADEGMMARIHENPESNLEQRTYAFDVLFTALKERKRLRGESK